MPDYDLGEGGASDHPLGDMQAFHAALHRSGALEHDSMPDMIAALTEFIDSQRPPGY